MTREEESLEKAFQEIMEVLTLLRGSMVKVTFLSERPVDLRLTLRLGENGHPF